jgi:hypothetical protein
MALTRIQTAALQSSITGSNITDGTIAYADMSTGHPFWDASGNVGIGTASPSTKFHVSGSASQNALISSTAGDVRVGFDATGAYYNWIQTDRSDGAFRFAVSNSEAMRLTTSGNLAVNTTNTTYSKVNIKATGSQIYSGLALFSNDGTESFMGLGCTGSVAGIYVTYGASGSYLPFVVGTGGSERARIDSSGNLGVGTTSPSTYGKLVSYNVSGASAYAISLVGNDQSNTRLRIRNTGGADFTIVGGTPGISNAGLAIFDETNSATRMLINSSGNVLINTTGNIFGARLAVVGAYPQVAGSFETNNSTYAAISCYASQGNYPADQIAFYATVSSNASLAGKITCTTSTVSYGSGSDYRLKNTITPMTGALAKVAQLKPVTFKWNVDESDGQGFIAHELQTVIPSAVSGEKDETDENGKPRYQTVDTSFLVATLTAAIQELKAENDSLKARLDAAGL